MRNTTICNKNRRQGVVLIVVLVLVMMVALAGFGFLSAMSTEYEAAKINGQLIQAQQTLASAESMLIWLTELSDEERQALGGLTNQPELFRGRTIRAVSSSEQVSGISETTSVTGNPWQFSVIHPVGTGSQSTLQFGLQNESARLHLAMVLAWEQAEAGAGRVALMQLSGMSEPLADALLDWLDADDEPREFGAESDYYQRLDKPYQPRNGIPQTIDELLFVKGITRELLRGSTSLTNDEFSFSESESVSDWTQLLTCTSAERNLNPEGKSKLNLNSTDLEKLHQTLSDYFDEPLVQYIILARQHGISLTEDEEASQSPAGGNATGVEPSEVTFSLSNPSQFTITSPASLIDSFIDVTSGSSTSRVVSPLQSSSPEFAETVELLFSRTTTNPSESIVGRININQASETVLKTLPEMTTEVASQIVQERESLEEPEKRTTAWLVSRQVISVNSYRKWFPYITTGGDVFTGEIVVFRKTGGPFLRRKLTIDAGKQVAAIVDWIDLTDQGLPTPLQLLFQSDTVDSQLPFNN